MGDVATLAVAMHLNSAGLKSESVDAFNSVASAAKSFTDTVSQQSTKAGAALTKIGSQARAAGTQFDGLQSHVAHTSTGLEQFRSVINGLAGGSNMAASTIANAMVPSLDRLFGSLNNATSGWKAQQAAAQEAANGLVDAANDAIAVAQAARTQSLAQAAIAEKTLATAAAQREQAFALDEYYEKQAIVNKEYGITVAYDEEHEQNARAIAEANLAEAAAQTKLAAATEAVSAADAAEIEGKARLVAAQEAVDLANQKVSLSSRAASAAGGAFNGLLGLVGGAPGLAIMAVVTSLTALYSWYEKTSDETKKFNAAIMENYGSMGLTANQLQGLAAQLGNTDGAIKSVTSAAKAGFTGDMLDQVAALGAQLNDLGGNSDELVKQLSSLRGDPLKALQELTNAGVVLNANQIEQIASLQRQGDIAEATATAEQYAMDVISQKIKSQQTDLQNNAGWWDKLKDSISGAMTAIGQADIDNARLMGNATGTDIDQPARNAQAVADQQKKQLEAQQKQAQANQNAALARIKTETDINTAIKAGADPKKEAAAITANINAEYKSGKLSADDYAAALRGVDKEYGNHKKASTAGINDGPDMLEQLQKQEAVLRAQGDDSDKLTDSQKKLAAFNAEVAGFDKNHLTAGQKSILAVQDQARALMQVNAGLEQANAQHELAVKLNQQNAEITEQTAQKQQEANNSLAEMTLSSPAYEQMTAEQQIRNEFADKRIKLDKEVTDHSSTLYSQETDFLASEQQKQLDIVSTTAAKKAEIDSSYSLGFKKGVTDWVTTASNAYEQMKSFAGTTFDTMASGLATFVTTGKLNFSTMATSIIADLIKIQLQAAASSALQSIFGIGGSLLPGIVGGATGAAGASTGSTGAMGLPTGINGYAKGDVFNSADLSGYSNSIVKQPTFFAFASGGGVMGEAGPEAIMPLTRASDGSLGVRATNNNVSQGNTTTAAPQVNIYISDSGSTTTQSTPAYQQLGSNIAQYVQTQYQQLLRKDLNPGGAIWRAVKGQ